MSEGVSLSALARAPRRPRDHINPTCARTARDRTELTRDGCQSVCQSSINRARSRGLPSRLGVMLRCTPYIEIARRYRAGAIANRLRAIAASVRTRRCLPSRLSTPLLSCMHAIRSERKSLKNAHGGGDSHAAHTTPTNVDRGPQAKIHSG